MKRVHICTLDDNHDDDDDDDDDDHCDESFDDDYCPTKWVHISSLDNYED